MRLEQTFPGFAAGDDDASFDVTILLTQSELTLLLDYATQAAERSNEFPRIALAVMCANDLRHIRSRARAALEAWQREQREKK